MADMSPEDMAAMQAQAGKDSGEGDATALVKKVGEGLQKLAEMLANSKSVTDKDMAQMDQIISLYVDLAEKKLGSAPGEDAEDEMSPEMTQMPMMQGRGGMPMGPQTKQ